jgi:hypothetical protein
MARGAKRARRRLACRLVLGRQRFSGVIIDLSASGIFVQTSAKPRPGDPVTLEFSIPGHREPLRLEAQVVRLKLVPPRLVAVAQGGLGLRITNAPEGYFGFLTAILPTQGPTGPAEALDFDADAGEDPAASEAKPGREPVGRRYRVYVRQTGGARSRTLHVEASSAEEAARRAFAETGDGWKLLEVVLDEESSAGR